jgi:adenosylcobinamide-phosphate synthase
MQCVFDAVGPILLALLLDRLLGEPPNRFHPVAWMGSLIGAVRRWVPRQGRWTPLLYGAGLIISGAVLVAWLGVVLERLLLRIPWPLGWLVTAAVLKLTFSLRGLAQAARQVQQALEAGDLPQAQHLLSWHLVSRDTSQLSGSQVAGAAVESVAENASDGLVAPLFYYLLGGLPAALAYRFLNTADAMLGYRDPVHEWLGKVPARLDDLVNLIPARLTACLMIMAAPFVGGSGRQAWVVWRRDARQTASPNAGQPMSAMAGALEVELEKVDHYRLGVGNLFPVAMDIARSLRIVHGTTVWAVVLLAGIRWLLCRLWP